MLIGSKGKEEVDAVFDSGATYSCIQPKLAKKLGYIESLPEQKKFGTAEKKRKVTAKERITLDFEVNGYRLSDEFMITRELSEPIIIGAKTLQAWRIKLNFETSMENFDIGVFPFLVKNGIFTMMR
ncbi:MAG: retropepsin-like aspartic protease [Candidatus Thermoplasmatota archaeon]